MNKLVEALPELLKKQAELDDYIMETKGLTHEETIESRKLAFVVELAECMQEWRGFKYWSDNQTPNASVRVGCLHCEGSGLRGADEVRGEICGECIGTGNVSENPLLQEYVDALHFALSLHNYCEGNLGFVQYNMKVVDKQSAAEAELEDITRHLLFVISTSNDDMMWLCGEGLLGVLLLGKALGLTSYDILREYDRKYRINIARQESGY